MAVMTRKIQIIPIGEDVDRVYQQLRDWRYHSWKLANHILSEHYVISQQVMSKLNNNPKLKWNEVEDDLMKKRLGDKLGKVKAIKASFGYCLSKEPVFTDNLPSAIRVSIANVIKGAYSTDIKQLLSGQKSLRNYKLNAMNIYIPSAKGKSSCFKFDEDKGYYTFNTIQKTQFKVNLGRDKSNNKEVIDRLIAGEYKMPDIFIKIEDKKLFVYVPVNIEKEKQELDSEISIGVDLGLAIPAYCAVSKGLNRLAIGSGKEIMDFRFQMNKRRRSLQRGIQLSNGGRGRKNKMKAMDKLRTYESDWVKTKNHQISKKIIDFALTNNAGCIKMELLEGFTKEHADNIVLKNWTYFQLQEMINYKAKNEGIAVVHIDPYHTSQTCSKCGEQHKDNRKSQSQFVCVNCGFESNADYNAAVNIARSTKIVKKKEECEYTKLKNK